MQFIRIKLNKALILCLFLSLIFFGKAQALTGDAKKFLPISNIIVVPNDTVYGAARNIFTAVIDGAEAKIDLAMYQLKDQGMIEALIRAAKRGVVVRIVTESNPYKHKYNQDKNMDGGIEQLRSKGILVQNIAPRFLETMPNAQAHHKLLLVDDEYAIVMSCNWDTPTLTNTRDFALVISKAKQLQEFAVINDLFTSDWLNKPNVITDKLVIVGPGGQREQFIEFISKTNKEIQIYQQSYNDEKIATVLEDKARQGIKIKLLMMPFPFGGQQDSNIPYQKKLVQAGGEVRLIKDRYIHAKMIMIDDKLAYIGSCNFYPSSLDFNREVGVVTNDHNAIATLKSVFAKDWKTGEDLKDNHLEKYKTGV